VKNLEEKLNLHRGGNDTGEIFVEGDPNSINSELNLLKNQFGFCYFLDMYAAECPGDDFDFKIYYYILNLDENIRIRYTVSISSKFSMPSVTSIWKCSDWYEREIHEMYGVYFVNRNLDRLLLPAGCSEKPMLNSFRMGQEIEATTPFGPYFTKRNQKDPLKNWTKISTWTKSTHLSFKLWLQSDEGKVSDSIVEVGFLHRGVEKLCQNLNLFQLSPYIQRVNSHSLFCGELSWLMAIEQRLQIKIPPKAMAIRMLLAEFSRIWEHFYFVEQVCLKLKMDKDIREFQFYKEYITELFENYTGRRQYSNVFIGGVPSELQAGWITSCYDFLPKLEIFTSKKIRELSKDYFFSEILRSDSIDGNTALELSLTGPTLRGCGINFDIRKSFPYYHYESVDFEIPLGKHGSSFDRVLVRLEEVRQSTSIILQLLDNLPTGNLLDEGHEIVSLFKAQDDGNFNALDLMNLIDGVKISKDVSYSSIEAGSGEWGIHLHGDGSNKASRLRISPPSFSLLQAFQSLVIGREVSEYGAFLESFGINSSEVDR
jgi:NADH-quinone oxidoreductase subunit C/D